MYTYFNDRKNTTIKQNTQTQKKKKVEYPEQSKKNRIIEWICFVLLIYMYKYLSDIYSMFNFTRLFDWFLKNKNF